MEVYSIIHDHTTMRRSEEEERRLSEEIEKRILGRHVPTPLIIWERTHQAILPSTPVKNVPRIPRVPKTRKKRTVRKKAVPQPAIPLAIEEQIYISNLDPDKIFRLQEQIKTMNLPKTILTLDRITTVQRQRAKTLSYRAVFIYKQKKLYFFCSYPLSQLLAIRKLFCNLLNTEIIRRQNL